MFASLSWQCFLTCYVLRPKPLVTPGHEARNPDLTATGIVPLAELKDALRVFKVFTDNDWMSFTNAMELTKAYWNLSATIASRSPSAPYRRADFWKARMAQERLTLMVRVGRG